MEKLAFTKYLGRLWRIAAREGGKSLIAYIFRVVGVVAAFGATGWIAGAYATPHALGRLVGGLVGALAGLIASWLWLSLRLGFEVWKEDQTALIALKPYETGGEALLLKELRDIVVPLPGPPMNALEFLLRCDDVLDRGAAKLDQLANAALGPMDTPWTMDKHDEASKAFHPFVVSMTKRQMLAYVDGYGSARYEWHPDGRAIVRRARALGEKPWRSAPKSP